MMDFSTGSEGRKLRNDIYGRLGVLPTGRKRFLETFHAHYMGPPALEIEAAEAACWLRQALEDIDALQARWKCLKPEIQTAVGEDWTAFLEK